MSRYPKGQSPGPGRPRGSRNKATLWLDELVAGDADQVIQVVKKHAVGGDMRAASILLARAWPQRRGRALVLDLPPVETPEGLVKAHAGVVAAMSRGEITADEAAAIGNVLETQRRAIETNDHELRLQELEKKKAGKPALSWDAPA